MADNKINLLEKEQVGRTPVTVSEFYTTIDNLYKKVVSDVNARLQAVKTELNNELKYTSAQINAFCEITQKDSAVMVERNQMAIEGVANELKYGYQQNQMIHEDLVHLVGEDLIAKLDEVASKYEKVDYEKIGVEATEVVKAQVERVLNAISELQLVAKIDEELVNRVTEKVVESLPFPERVDYKQIEELVQAASTDANMLADVVAEKVLEKIPARNVENINYELIGDIVAERMPLPEAIDYDRLAETVLTKMPVVSGVENIDYEVLSDMIVAKMSKPQAVDYEMIAEMVTAKMLASEDEKDVPEYDVILDQDGVDKVAEGVYERLNFEAVAEKVSEKISALEQEEINYELLADMVADRLAVKVEILTEPIEEEVEEVQEVATEEPVEEVVEEVAEPVTEEVVEEVVEEVAEVVTEETVEEVVVEEPVETVQEEVAATIYENEAGELVNAETGLVLRLKRSFEAKLKQSDESVKGFYDQIKNELVSYKKVKSTVSWHGDRFNFGRATVAKMNICGKTLCFYVALDPADPELKETVYHQKDVGDQKAYQATPFKVKVKSDMGAKRAVRLVNVLAEKIGVTKDESFVPTNYAEEYAYETTQELLEKGLIKETQEKKIDFEF